MNVLVATDGSQYGQWGLNWVATLPFVTPPRVTALHVLDLRAIRAPRGPLLSRAVSKRYLQKEIERMETHSAKTIKKATEQLALLKLKGTVCEERGAVESVILKCAQKRGELLVVGSRGLDALDRFMLGSVSTNLIQHATCSVLVVKGEAPPVRQITLATDGSDASAKALAFVLSKFQSNHAADKSGYAPIHVSVIHVMSLIEYPGLKKAGDRIIEQSVRKLVEAGFTADPVCRFGRSAEEIMKAASETHADLIVMGSRGLSTIARVLLGSVSTRVVQRATCAVLVVR
jgi:nucleotide-binding universal stress UspA family protein